MTIGKTRGALRGMWMDAIPRVYSVHRDQAGTETPMSRKGFGGGPGTVGKPRKVVERGEKGGEVGETENVAEGGLAARPKTVSGKGGKKGDGECYLHGPFLGDMLPGQMLRMKRGFGEVQGWPP